MTENPIDEPGMDWSKLDPGQAAALAGMSQNFAVARRLISCLATSAELDDGGDALARLCGEIANGGDPVGVALAIATEYVQVARGVYGEHLGQVLAIRAQRQLDIVEQNRQAGG